jgi:preprotein translocase subunit SecF
VSVRSLASRLYNGETEFDFIGRWKRWFALSALVIVFGAGGLLVRGGLNLGIDFEGGVSWQAPIGDSSVGDVRDAVEGAGLDSPTVQSIGTGGQTQVRVQSEAVENAAANTEVEDAIKKATGAETISRTEVGPSWGSEISRKALRALFIFLILVSLYIAFRFEWKMAVATLAALVHDILVTIGVYALFGLPVTPATVIAFLTILGYSIYDGIVVFDRVDENVKRSGTSGVAPYATLVNTSMNEVLMRTLNTSITALLPILSLLVIGSLVLGATSLQEFGLALFIGLLSGAYSSIFIASPTLALLKEREGRWVAVRRRLEGRGLVAGNPILAGATATGSDDDIAGDTPVASSGPFAVQPRGRKKGKRR